MKHNYFQWWHGLLGIMPFFMMVNGKPKLVSTRIAEAVIIAVLVSILTTAASTYVIVTVMDYRVAAIERKVDKIYNDIYKPYMGDSAR